MRLMTALLFALPLLAACGDKDDTASGDDTAASGDDGGGGSDLDGEALYATYCSACHGTSGEGGYGPALDGEFEEKSDEQIVDIILNGDGSMAPVAVSEDEAYAIVEWYRTTM